MLDSQIVLDQGMEKNLNARSRSIMKTMSRKRHRSFTGSGTNFDVDDQNQLENNAIDQSFQMLTILREEKRKSIIPRPLSPAAVSSSTPKSPVKSRPGPASRTLKRKSTSDRQIKLSKGDTRMTGGDQIPPSSLTNKKFAHPLGKNVCGPRSSKVRRLTAGAEPNNQCQDDPDPDVSMVVARNTRTKKSSSHQLAGTTGVTVKSEKSDDDDGYESLLAPAEKENDQIKNVEAVVATAHACPICQKEFSQIRWMKYHVAQAHPDPKTAKHHRCPHCDWSSFNPRSLKSHIVLSHPDKAEVYECRKCEKKFTNKRIWQTHNCSNDLEKKRGPTCLSCQTTFQSRRDLVFHKINHCKRGPVSPPFKCKKCSKIFTKLSNFSKHLRNCLQLKGVTKEPMDKNDVVEESLIEDPEDTRDDHVSCKECEGKLFTKEVFEKHQQQTGHSGETIRLPRNLSI